VEQVLACVVFVVFVTSLAGMRKPAISIGGLWPDALLHPFPVIPAQAHRCSRAAACGHGSPYFPRRPRAGGGP